MNSKLKKRYRSDFIFKAYSYMAVAFCLIFLFSFFGLIAYKASSAFRSYHINLPIENISEIKTLKDANNAIIQANMKLFDMSEDDASKMNYIIISRIAKNILFNKIKKNKQFDHIIVPLTSNADIYLKYGELDEKFSDVIKDKLQQLKQQKIIKQKFNILFFTNGDSQDPEIAGIIGSIAGSFMCIAVCLIFALPIGIMGGMYLEEFAPKNKFTDFIEININNLAAVPSIIFGLLGLGVYINFMDLPRSSTLVGGLTLGIIILPVIVITTRQAIRTVPPSLKQAVIALGASPMQVLLHYTLPLSMPGIMTGTILGISRVLGETAPLIMIGMVAFIVDIPANFTDPATVMPVQVFLWAESLEQGFIEKTAAAIVTLLVFLVSINLVAVFIRKKYQITY
jgi:phosphate transport system permease protein